MQFWTRKKIGALKWKIFVRCIFLEGRLTVQATQADQADKAEKAEKAEKAVIRKKKSKEFEKRRPSIEKKDWDHGWSWLLGVHMQASMACNESLVACHETQWSTDVRWPIAKQCDALFISATLLKPQFLTQNETTMVLNVCNVQVLALWSHSNPTKSPFAFSLSVFPVQRDVGRVWVSRNWHCIPLVVQHYELAARQGGSQGSHFSHRVFPRSARTSWWKQVIEFLSWWQQWVYADWGEKCWYVHRLWTKHIRRCHMAVDLSTFKDPDWMLRVNWRRWDQEQGVRKKRK